MAVHRYVRFAAPYRSKTFNDKDALVVGRNGVLAGGSVTQSGSVVTIQPVTVIQNGQIVDISTSITGNAPLNMSPPYHIALTFSSGIENVSETITPTFIKRPQDINSQTVLVAAYDGVEWVTMPRVQLAAQADEAAQRATATGHVGIATGFDVTSTGSALVIDPGTLVDVNGKLIVRNEPTTLPLHPTSTISTLTRVDNVVYRKPQDHPSRVGLFKNVVGPTFFEGGGYDVAQSLMSAAVLDANANKILQVPSNENFARFTLEGDSLSCSLLDVNFYSVGGGLVATGVLEFDACALPDGGFGVVYIDSGGYRINYLQLAYDGSAPSPAVRLLAGTYTLRSPRIALQDLGSATYKHIVFLKDLNTNTSAVHYARMSSTGLVETPDCEIVNLNTKIRYPALAINNNDSLLYLAFTDDSAGKTYLHTYDLATVTQAGPPTLSEPPVELQNDTQDAGGNPASTTGSAYPTILLTDTMDLYVVWRHFLGSGMYGLAIYHKDFKAKFGYKAKIVVFSNPGTYSCAVDGLNNFYYVETQPEGATSLEGFSIDLNMMVQTNQFSVAFNSGFGGPGPGPGPGPGGPFIGACTLPSILFTMRGELLIQAVNVGNNSSQLVTSIYPACVERSQRDSSGASSDINIANISLPDGALYVNGYITEENIAVKRLYDHMSMCVGTGSVSWQKTGQDQLTIITPLYVKFIDRDGVLVLQTGNITVPENSAVLVEIPDEDVGLTLTPEVVKFGEAIHDRHGRKKVVIFWNLAGFLYTRFAPYRLTSDGETVILGDALSKDMMDWLGSSDSTPNPSNHGYSSTTYIQQSDSHNVALGKLDQALTDYSNHGTAAVIPLSNGATSISVTFGSARSTSTYRLGIALQNLVDTYPMIVPCIVTAKTASGFTVTWTDTLDSANYSLNYVLRDTV